METDETDPGNPNLSMKSVVEKRRRAGRAREVSQDSGRGPLRSLGRSSSKLLPGGNECSLSNQADQLDIVGEGLRFL